MNKRFKLLSVSTAVLLSFVGTARAEGEPSDEVIQQIKAIYALKASLTPAQKKMDSALAYGLLLANGDARVAPFANAISPLGTTSDVAPSRRTLGAAGPTGTVAIDITGTVGDALASAITAAGGTIISKSVRWGVITAALPVGAVSSIAERSDVTRMRVSSAARTNVGGLTSQGYVSHEANKAIANYGFNGTGVKVGVLSDSALPARIAALKATGDLKSTATVLPGQDGPSDGSDEGAAMMEIVQDMAPGADIIFATAFTSETSFADNIIALAAAGCKVIVDDVSYFDEGVFQDGPVAQAVNQVTAAGVIYFSSAANSGSLTKATSGTYEADFKDGGAVTGPILTFEGQGKFHNFATTGTTLFNTITTATPYVQLKWSDPLAGAVNDYDVIVTNATGTTILGVGADPQDGTGDPYEIAFRTSGANFPAGARVYVVQYSGAARALHLDTVGGSTLGIATAGAVYGHNGGDKTVSVAATYWNSAKTGTKPFTGFPNTNETFSSDGPRRIFYSPTGTPLTAGLLFATGGVTLSKPDIAAADGVSTKTPGFLPFFGTSAAAPHAAGIAALIRSARPDYTVDQVKAAMKATALDSMAAGVDRDSGSGVAMANAAVQYALTH